MSIKEKGSAFFSKFGWLYRPLMITFIGGFVVWLFKYTPQIMEAIEYRTFSTVESKVLWDQFSRNIDLRKELEHYLNHVNDTIVHATDSSMPYGGTLRTEIEDIIKNHAIDNYNVKRTNDRILEGIDELRIEVKDLKELMDIIKEK